MLSLVQSEHAAPPPLSFDEMIVTRRLSGYCLAPIGARALCYSHNTAMRDAMRTYKPALDWYDAKDTHDLDLLVGNGLLQKAYSRGGKTLNAVRSLLAELMEKLNTGGRLVLRENALLIPEQMVLLELPDHRAKIGEDDPSQAVVKRLLDFAKTARSWLPAELRGFFVEEIAPVKQYTRVFRLPLKWAAEFLLRKDLNDEAWAASLDHEMILGSESLLRTQIFNPLGLRVVLSAPHWDTDKTTDNFKGTFHLYSDDDLRTPLPPPATELILVAQKVADDDGLWMMEQRTHEQDAQYLGLSGVQNTRTGDMMTMVTGLAPETQIFPWCRLAGGGLGVFLQRDVATPMINALPRGAHSIDGRRFSSHTAHPVCMDMNAWDDLKATGKATIASWLFDRTGLRLAPYSEIMEGKLAFPAPDFIDHALGTVFMEVRGVSNLAADMVCFEASDVLQAIHAGLLPSATLEAQIWQLARHADVEIIPLTDRALEIDIDPDADDALPVTDFEALCRKLAPEDGDGTEKESSGFRDVRGHQGDWRITRSLFVEESAAGPQRAYDQEFVINDGEPLHRAALMCLSRRMQGETLAGFELVDCPVPTRYGKPGKMVRVPTISLPTTLRSMPEARNYIAEKLEVSPEYVVPCGEAVFTHVGVTPQKVFPFLITRSSWFKHYNYILTPLKNIRRLTQLDNHYSILWYWGAVMAFLSDESDFSRVNAWENRTAERHAVNLPDMVMRPVV